MKLLKLDTGNLSDTFVTRATDLVAAGGLGLTIGDLMTDVVEPVVQVGVGLFTIAWLAVRIWDRVRVWRGLDRRPGDDHVGD